MAVARRKAETSGIVNLLKPFGLWNCGRCGGDSRHPHALFLLLSSNSLPRGYSPPWPSPRCAWVPLQAGACQRQAQAESLLMEPERDCCCFWVLIAGSAGSWWGWMLCFFLRLTLMVISASLGGVIGVNLKTAQMIAS